MVIESVVHRTESEPVENFFRHSESGFGLDNLLLNLIHAKKSFVCVCEGTNLPRW